eukprot:gb/GECH01011591.1/.p1 GENE.gb/GECH01011591.1/~~gb/GECH01011591.1/.p1  ORF type:complete len:148 (+),score=60.30 gb/GECH01011591.1/:1-444(+)
MPRRSKTKRAAPKSRASASKSKSATPSAANTPAKTQQAPQQQQQQQAAQGGGVGGFLKDAAATAAGVATGHAVSNALFGGNSNEAAAESSEAGAGPMGNTNNAAANACQEETQEFMQCLKNNSNDIGQCQWFFDSLQSCSSTNEATF